MTEASALACVSALTIILGLVADSQGGPWGQPLVGLWVWIWFAVLLWRLALWRGQLVLCLFIATAGELVLSLLWGLYDYREGGIPLFVPPGHALLFGLGLHLAPRLPSAVHRATTALSLLGVSGLALAGVDGFGPILLLVFLACLRWGPAPRLYTTMFLLSLLMELWGTALGCWSWRSLMPGTGWPVSNPPLAAGAFYCVLDILAGWSAKGRRAGAEGRQALSGRS